MNPSRAILFLSGLQFAATVAFSWRGSSEIMAMFAAIGERSEPASPSLALAQSMSSGIYPIIATLILAVGLLLAFRGPSQRLQWIAFGMVALNLVFLASVLAVLIAAMGSLGPRML